MATPSAAAPSEQEIEKMVRDYQMVQEQLRNSALQLDQLQGAKADLDRAKAEIDKAEGKVYLTVGGVIVETSKEKALAEIKERAELTEVRVQSATKQYNELKTREKQLGEKLTSLYQQGRPQAGA
jgi:prefoldin beta subunit